jgi:hypothetical protein
VGTRRPRAADRTGEPQAARAALEQDAGERYPYDRTPPGASQVERKEPSLGELARVSNAGVCLAASCKRGKGEAGRDASQGRTWDGWHHHLALALSAVGFWRGEPPRGQQLPPALTLPPVRSGLSGLLLEVCGTPGRDDICRPVSRQ